MPADIWRDFHKGDRSVFARHLFRTRDSYVIPAIEQRYAEDDRFRDLVSRYMDRFEVLLARAQRRSTRRTFLTLPLSRPM